MVRHCPNPDCVGLARDGVVAEYRDSVSECLDCGSELATGERPVALDVDSEYLELVTVFIASDIAQGQVVASVVEAAGIPVFLKGEHLVGAVGELPATVAQLELQVPVERAEEARAITRDWERPGAAVASDGSGVDPGSGPGDAVHGAVADALERTDGTDADAEQAVEAEVRED